MGLQVTQENGVTVLNGAEINKLEARTISLKPCVHPFWFSDHYWHALVKRKYRYPEVVRSDPSG
jgi:hypothetical protein